MESQRDGGDGTVGRRGARGDSAGRGMSIYY